MEIRVGLARFGDFELDLRSGELRRESGKVIRLSEQPLRILITLLERPGEVVLREEIRKKLWPNDTVVEFEHSISAAMNRLRQGLGDSGEDRRYIETLARRGYRWTVPVEWIQPSPAAAPPPLLPTTEDRAAGEILTGKRVSHYRVLEVLGGGGMGVVYKAEDLRLGRLVAIKFLAEEFTGNQRALERFEREARTISALDHPNICTIHEVEEHEGRPFIVMQLLQGQTLRQRIESAAPKQLPFSGQELLDIAIAIARGLDAAHQKGIIHRDIKPANIFITARGEIKLLDFGLAKLVSTEAGASEQVHQQELARPIPDIPADISKLGLTTLTGATMGTASYMSPEQVRREPLDPRTDLFSFGAVLYEMATGLQPFRGDTTDAIHDAILHCTPPSARLGNPNLPPAVEGIIFRALEKDREKRYQSAAEIIADLERTGPRRSRWPNAGIAAAALLLLALAGVVLLRRETRVSPISMEIARLTDTGRADQAAISPNGRYVAYSQQETSGATLSVCETATGAIWTLPVKSDTLFSSSFSPDGNYIYYVPHKIADVGWHSLYVMPTRGGPPRLLIKNVIDSPISFSPDGQHFAFTNGVGASRVELRIANKDGSDNRLLAVIPDGNEGFQPGPAWSPDGRTIAVPAETRGGFALEAISVADGRVRNLYSNRYGIGRPVWLSSDQLVVPLKDRSGRGQLWSMSYPRAQLARLTNDLEDYREFGIGFSRGSKTLAATVSNQFANAWVAPATSPSQAQQITLGKMSLLGLGAGAEDKILIRTGDGRVWIMDRDGSHRSQFTDTRKALAVTACGRFVLIESYTSAAVDLTRVNADGTGAVKLARGDIGPPVCSNSYVFYTNPIAPTAIRRIPIQGGAPLEIAKSPGLAILGRVALSPDAKLLAFIYDEATIAAGTTLAVIPSTGGPILKRYKVSSDASGLCWSPDGQGLQYLLSSDPVTNIWEQPLSGGPPRQLTKFPSGRIFDFNWSRDGKRLLLARGEISSDVVLLSDLH